MKDYSEYLDTPGMLAYIELEWSRNKHIHEEQAEIINEVIKKYNIKSVMEFGAGTGLTAALIHFDNYIVSDKNKNCIELAGRINPTKMLSELDVRDLAPTQPKLSDLVFCFAFLKHFSLDEWGTIFNKIASAGNYFVFDMPVSGVTIDDGVEYHHVWMREDEIRGHIERAGLELLEIKNPESAEPVFICKRIIIK